MTLPRALLVVLVLALVATAVGTVVSLVHDPPRPRMATSSSPSSAPPIDPLAVLHRWDARRAEAWARGDAVALRRLYAAGSTAGERDLAMLRSWHRRGLRVEGMRMQVLAGRVQSRTERRLVLLVTDRLVGGTAVGDGVRTALPRDEPSTRRIVLRRVRGSWRVAVVTG